jgi:hypothetical protein
MASDDVRRDASRRAVRARNDQRAAIVAESKAGRLLSTDEVATRLGVSATSVSYYVKRGLLRPSRVEALGLERLLFDPTEVNLFRREWAITGGEHRSRWLDPDWYVEIHRARGITQRAAEEKQLSLDDMDAVYRARAIKRASQFGRARRGRRPQTTPPEHHIEWAAKFDFLEARFSADYERDLGLGLDPEPPSKRAIYLAIADDDFVRYPERWGGYCDDGEGHLHPRWEKSAIDRVAKAVRSMHESPANRSD